MNSYEAKITVEFTKDVVVKAHSSSEAVNKLEEIFLTTDLIKFDEENIKSITCETESFDENDDENCCADDDECECCILYDELY